jgi:CRP/FNR family cyclic AMP-dependent transcriptional regulator
MNGDDLRSVGFFEFLSPEELVEFAEASELVTYTPGETLIEEESEPSSLLVLTFGHVEVSKRIPGHGERILAEIDAANEKTVVGERGLLDSRGASATVRAKGEVEAIKIPREKFRAMISAGNPAAYKLATRITRILARRLVRLNEEVVETIRELEDRGETDLDVFRDKLVTEWTV